MGSPGFLTSPMFNVAFMIVAMQLGKRIDWEDPQVLMIARFGYYGAQVLVLLLTFGLMRMVQNKNDTTPLKYVETKPGPDQGKEVQTTNVEYDVAQVRQLISSTMTSVLMISVMHWYFKFTQPLLMQSIMPFKNLAASKVGLIYIWNDPATGSLQRPFQAENPLAALLGGGATAPAATEDSHQKKD
ncbi:putative phosphate transporter [Hesseltinella vesiculosa]|uniref:Putative phosphate transporter n=1 Tax=Hesseltinella vesiculosa TaxID=101127 RepID=A0A1X2GHP7_9FUNG|nr:putative phosphate transporter [Hesseltinella vesiculosa]